MGKPALTLLLLLASIFSCLAQPKITHYDLKYSFDFEEKKLFGTAVITVDKLQAGDTLNLLLYRLLRVKSIKDINGQPIKFSQTVKAFDDWEQLQVNSIQIVASSHIQKLAIDYDGYLAGYTETGMLYTKDHIDSKFTLLREDCFAYPVPGVTNWEKNSSREQGNFDYKVLVVVPDSLKVVNGGSLDSKTSENNLTTYVYTNRKPAWRIDIAIGEYRVHEDRNFDIHYFPEDSSRVKDVANYMTKAYTLYKNWFGEISNDHYTVIEIPNQWGSQADVTCILQEASAIKDDKHMYEIYHEVSHIWNVTSLDPNPSRLESEGLAMFLQSLVTEKLHGNSGALDAAAERTLKRLKAQFARNPVSASTPIAQFGPKQLTDVSYTKGMLFFYVLYQEVGEEKFMKAIREFYSKYRSKGATLKDFSESVSGSLPGKRTMIDEWLFTGISSEKIIKSNGLKELIKK